MIILGASPTIGRTSVNLGGINPGVLEAQIAYYLEHWQPHLLAVYDPAFLAKLVESRVAAPSHGRLGMEAFSRS